MKRFILLLGILCAPILKAHFFATQQWTNPKTGQTLREYYDVHRTDAQHINPTALRKNLIEDAKNNNALVITEDKPSLHFGGIDYTDSSDANKQTIKNYMQDFPLDCSLAWSCAECFVNDIPTYNAECRELNSKTPLNIHYEEEVARYDDGPILNAFYASLKQLSQDLAGVNQRESSFNYKCFIVDARALHALHTSKNDTNILAMGATHIIRINRMLMQLGWQPGPLMVPTGLDAKQKDTLTKALTPDAENLHATLDAWSTYLNNHVDAITNNAIDIDPTKAWQTTGIAHTYSPHITWWNIILYIVMMLPWNHGFIRRRRYTS